MAAATPPVAPAAVDEPAELALAEFPELPAEPELADEPEPLAVTELLSVPEPLGVPVLLLLLHPATETQAANAIVTAARRRLVSNMKAPSR